MEATDKLISTFEHEVYNILSKCLSEGEALLFDKKFDFSAPNGIKKLKWPKETFIEVKYRLIYNSFSRIKYYYDALQPQKLIVIVFDFDNESPRLYNNVQLAGRNIEILSYDSLIKKIETLPNNLQEKPNKKDEATYWREKDSNIREKASNALKNNKISLFLGAGVSASAGVVTWNSLLEQLCIKRGISKIDSDIESVVKGRYIIDEYKKEEKKIPDEFYQDMRNILYSNTKDSSLIKSLAKIIKECKIESIISYNYDDLIEQEVKKTNPCYSVYAKTRPIDDKSYHVYHVHGFIPKEGEWSEIVLGEKEYHKIYQESYNWGNVEQLHALCRSTCFFIGLSMTDPNLRRLIDISIEGSEIEPAHFAFLRRIEYNVQFTEKVLRGFGVNCVWYDKHEDLPKLLNSLIR